jgi:glycine oxidase
MSDVTSDVVVVGGGIVGCACALALADRGLEVVVLERAGLVAAASGRNRGLLLPHPDPVADGQYREGVAGYRRLAEEAAIPFGPRPTGLLAVAADETGLAELERLAGTLGGLGHAVELLDPAMLAKLEPCLAPDLAGGLRYHEAWEVDPTAATLAFAAAARRAGAVFRTHQQAHRLLVDGDRVTGVAVDGGPLAAGAVVGASLATSLREDSEHPETVRGLARRARRFVPGLAGVPVVATWSGVRPVTPDGRPLVGPAPGLGGLWVAAGHGPIGVLAAPATARMLADHLMDGHADPAAAPFDPARFTTPAPTRAGAASR